MRTSPLSLSAVAVTAALIACSSPKAEPGIPITGVIGTASGAIAPLTAGAQDGTGFSLVATLGSQQVAITNAPWKCYSPAPQFPNFDIEATDGSTYLFAISISPGSWSPGVKTIDGENVIVGLVIADRAVIATSGTLTLSSAGTVADNQPPDPIHYCKFELQDLAVFGERDADSEP